MRIFLAGATGVLGVRLLPLLVVAGHTVAGMTRTPAKAEQLRALSAQPIVCDALDPTAVHEAVTGFAPQLVVDELTDLPDDPARIDEHRAAQNRMRREGISNLLVPAQAVGARVISQSIAWTLDADAQAAVDDHDRLVADAGGVLLRYGQFYGPGTFYEHQPPEPPRVHTDQAARRTVLALDAPARSAITIVD